MDEVVEQKDAQLYSFTPKYFDDFKSYIDVSERTLSMYTRNLTYFSKYMRAHEITHPQRQDLLAYRAHLQRRGLKATTIANYMAPVRVFFEWLSLENLYPNIAKGIKVKVTHDTYKRDYLTSAQVKDVLDSIETTSEKGLRDYAIIWLMATGALRTVEVSNANIEDLQPKNDYTVLYVQGKGRKDKDDYIKVPHTAEKAIRAYLASRNRYMPKDALFVSTSNHTRGERLSTRAISALCKERFKQAGYDSPRLTAHSLRHTAVTLALAAGEPLQEVQRFARHANVQNTMIYAHGLEKENNTCESSIERLIMEN